MAQEPADTGSVFDFFFVDHARIALYNSQFSGRGSMRRIVESQSHTGAKNLKGGVPAVVNVGVDQGTSETQQRQYDPYWIEPLTFLDNVQEREMLNSDLASATVGSLVQVKVEIDFLNLDAIKRVWPALAEGQGPAANRKQRRASAQGSDDNITLGLKLFGALDHYMLMVFRSSEGRLWAAVDPENVVGAAGALHWKLGATMGGDWYVIGIIDCSPGKLTWPDAIDKAFTTEPNFSENFFNVMSEIANLIGRPEDCYGITPLIVLREI